MKFQYCPTSKGILLLNKSTDTEWRAISPLMLSQNMCVATILPARSSNSFPILDQCYYLPKTFHDSAGLPSKSTQLYKFLKTTTQRMLKIMPSVKYSLEGIQLSMIRTFETFKDIVVVEGTIRLTGDMVVKPTAGIHSISLSLNDKTGQVTLIDAEQARTEFVSSLTIGRYLTEGKPSLTINSSLDNKIVMTSTNIQLTMENINSAKITATSPLNYFEIKNRSDLTLEIQIGYEFSGKATHYPNLSDTKKHLSLIQNSGIETKRIAEGTTIGSIILCVFDALATLLLAV